MKKCSVDGCNNNSICKGLCNKHYLRLKRNGILNSKYEKRGENSHDEYQRSKYKKF